jgi:hypothetical protein
MKKLWLIFCAFSCSFIYSCVDHNIPEQPFDCEGVVEISFKDDLKETIETTCTPGCHDGTNGAERNWLIFSNIQNKSAQIKDRITRPEGAEGHMPKTGSLTHSEIQSIVCWVEQGAQDN